VDAFNKYDVIITSHSTVACEWVDWDAEENANKAKQKGRSSVLHSRLRLTHDLISEGLLFKVKVFTPSQA
jgi:hypothetical protein